MIKPIYVIAFLGLSVICVSILLLVQSRPAVISIMLNSSQQTVQLGSRNAGERAKRSVILSNPDWFSDKEVLSITPNCGCLKVTPQNFVLESGKQMRLALSINEFPKPYLQRFVTIIEWKEIKHSEHHHSIINFDINNLDIIKLEKERLSFNLSTSPQQAVFQAIPFQRGESSVAWNQLVLEQNPLIDTNITWLSQNSGVINVRPNLAKCQSLSDTTSTSLVLHCFADKNEMDLVASRDINIEIINNWGVQIFPTTFYFGKNKYADAVGKTISVELSRKNDTVRCLQVQSDDPRIKVAYLNNDSQVSLSAKIVEVPTVKFLTGFITAEIQDKKIRSIEIPYYAIFE